MNGRLPAFELHCHLDGCVRPGTIAALAREQGLELDAPAEQLAMVSPAAASLVDYLQAIDVALAVLQTEDALNRAARELVEDWAADGVLHGEARFAPQLHTRRGLRLPAVVGAVAAGLREGAQATGVDTSLILCSMRQNDPAMTWEVVEHAATDPDVTGIDIAGPEYGIPLLPHALAFQAGRAAGLRVTVHAGEAGGADFVWQAIDEFGAERIGHGVKAIHDEALVRRLAADQICLELCPTSNLHTHAVTDLAAHPIEAFRQSGVPISLSTDAHRFQRLPAVRVRSPPDDIRLDRCDLERDPDHRDAGRVHRTRPVSKIPPTGGDRTMSGPTVIPVGSVNLDRILRVADLPAVGDTVLALHERQGLGAKGGN